MVRKLLAQAIEVVCERCRWKACDRVAEGKVVVEGSSLKMASGGHSAVCSAATGLSYRAWSPGTCDMAPPTDQPPYGCKIMRRRINRCLTMPVGGQLGVCCMLAAVDVQVWKKLSATGAER